MRLTDHADCVVSETTGPPQTSDQLSWPSHHRGGRVTLASPPTLKSWLHHCTPTLAVSGSPDLGPTPPRAASVATEPMPGDG